MNNENFISRLFIYIVLAVAVIVGIWLSFRIEDFKTFLLNGILGLILCGIVLFVSIKLCINNSVNFYALDLACSLVLLGLSVWGIFSNLKLWV